MKQKGVVLQNKGISRDLSVSKASNEFAFDNHNIRITADQHDTLISVTNERGNKMYDSLYFEGELVGWNVLNTYIILFTVDGDTSYIYRVEYKDGEFESLTVFSGALGFDTKCPIESVVDYESEDIQKIYWIDGKNVLRFMNFSNAYLEKHFTEGHDWDNPEFTFKDDATWFDSTKPASGIPSSTIKKDNGGNTRANGVAQYFLTYYNKNGQQTGIVWSSSLVYLSPNGRGGASDETNTNRITLTFTGLDYKFEYVRLYQLLRTSEGNSVGYLIGEASIGKGKATFVDDGANLTAVDVSSFLYFGSQFVVAGTMTHKDGTLFLGDLQSIGNSGIEALENSIQNNAFVLSGETFSQDVDWETKIVSFEYSDTSDLSSGKSHIPYVKADGYYPYESQLNYPSDKITTFKGGEKYRFGLQFSRSNGVVSKTFWIGDKVNPYYPQMNSTTIRRAVAVCTIPDDIIEKAVAAGFSDVKLMIAEATAADRSVLVQGIVNPTMFNLHNRQKGTLFSQASWIYRAKGGALPFRHLDSLLRSDKDKAELQNTWWDGDTPIPLYFKDSSNNIVNTPYGAKTYAAIEITVVTNAQTIITKYWGKMTVKYYIDINSAIPDKTEVINLGGGAAIYHNSLLQYIRDWLNAYDKADVPIAHRVGQSKIREECENALNASNHTSTYTLNKTAIDLSSDNQSDRFAKESKEYFFVDENIVTLNSPEIEYETINVDRNSGLKFRIVGAALLTANQSDYNISASNFKYPASRIVEKTFSTPNISYDTSGLESWPLYVEYGVTDDAVDVSKTWSYMSYMWHKSGSIPQVYENYIPISVLTSKRYANLRFAYSTVYNNYRQNEWSVSPTDVRQFNSVSNQLYELKVNSSNKSYAANVDDLITMPDEVEYPVFYSEKTAASDSMPELKSEVDSSSPVRMTYNSRPHAVISLPSGYRDTILPYIYDEDAFSLPEAPSGSDGPLAPWKEASVGDYKLIYREVSPSDVSDITKGSYANFTEKEVTTSTATLVCNNENTIGELGVVELIANNKYPGKGVYVHITDDHSITRMFYLADIKEEGLEVRARYGNGTVGVLVEFSSKYPLESVECEIYGILSNNGSPVLIFSSTQEFSGENTFSASFVTAELEQSYRQVQVSYLVKYAWKIEVSDYYEYVIPAVNKTAEQNRLYVDPNRWCRAYTSRYKALYRAQFLDITGNTVDYLFYNIADKGSIIKLDATNHVFTYEGLYSNLYQAPYQVKYTIPRLTQKNEYLFIGELYKDFDANQATDTRYGGITKYAVNNNRFVAASSSVSLTNKETVETYVMAEIDCTDVLNYLSSRVSVSGDTIDFYLWSENDTSVETIHLDSLSGIDVSSTLPTSTNKTSGLSVTYDTENECWISTITGITLAQATALANNADYKVAVLRMGYARRGKWRKYINKYGEMQSSHTRRDPKYRLVRRGYANSLQAYRLRIIGYDLLISNKPHTWKSNRYSDGVISSFGGEIVLPALAERHKITSNNRISNNSNNGLCELYIGLYHKENNEWKLVSNTVQVRGRKDECTKMWEFDYNNVVLDTGE